MADRAARRRRAAHRHAAKHARREAEREHAARATLARRHFEPEADDLRHGRTPPRPPRGLRRVTHWWADRGKRPRRMHVSLSGQRRPDLPNNPLVAWSSASPIRIYRNTFAAIVSVQLALLGMVIGIDHGTIPEPPVAVLALGMLVIAVLAGSADRKIERPPGGARIGFRLPTAQPDIQLDPPLRRGEPWRRRYRLRLRWTIWGAAHTIMSDDIAMSDPQSQRLWRWVSIISFTITGVSALALLIAHLT